MDEYWKRSGQIPAFGNWDFQNELPITRYFETARQAGLIHHPSSYGEADPYVRCEHDLYAVDFKKATRIRDRRYTNSKVKETRLRKHGKVCDVTEYPNKPLNKKKVNDVVHSARPLPSKPVDEDLYKISPQLLRTTKRKKMLGFISNCLLPTACFS
ncbi:uncharacterized protein LOC131612887 [Vicia villosa]|uniref:uncharacterized protein LOC131612887 n=1 Tax=Vicia villosa TaxID=3911 RepID=UPI00273C695D|nr:uncharacterized protein LOC131612887 [Vicia villosa]